MWNDTGVEIRKRRSVAAAKGVTQLTKRSVGSNLVVSLAVFLLLLTIYVASPNATPYDSRWTIHTALSIIHEGNTNLDEYLPLLVRDKFYAIECMDEARRTFPVTSTADCPSGHYLNFYPVSVAVMAVPGVWVIEKTLLLGQPWLRPLSERMPTEQRRRFLQADLVSSSMLTELLIASFITAAAGAIMYSIASSVLPTVWAIGAALIFGLCTPAWSAGSRALWQHGPSMLLLAASLLFIIRGAASSRLLAVAGLLLAAAFFVRPTNVLPLLGFAIYVFRYNRTRFPAFVSAMVPVAVAHTLYTLAVYGAWLAPYSFVTRANAPGLAFHSRILEALAGNLFSPSRGLLIYVPLFVFCLAGLRLSDPRKNPPDLNRYVAAICVAHWLLISLFEEWWGGDCYGPRYFSDLMPFFVYLLTPVIWLLARDGLRTRPILAGLFVLLDGCSFVIHQQGAMNWACLKWNVCPAEIRHEPWRIWDWSDPQFLRGFNSQYADCVSLAD